MYIPSANRVDDRRAINAFIQAHGFATLITHDGSTPTASHLPVLLDEAEDGLGLLRSHMARANQQWRQLAAEREVLCIFHGPHSYITPSWYVMQHTVPTWNYAAVHVYGKPTLVTDLTELRQIVYDTTTKYESSMPKPWTIPLSEAEVDAMLKAVVGFTIAITRLEAKFKLGQNRSQEDQDGMLRGLQQSTDSASRELATFIAGTRDDGTGHSSDSRINIDIGPGSLP